MVKCIMVKMVCFLWPSWCRQQSLCCDILHRVLLDDAALHTEVHLRLVQ